MRVIISESKKEKMSEYAEKMLKYGGKLMQCIDELGEDDDYGERDDDYDDDDDDLGYRQGGNGQGGYGNRDEMGYRRRRSRRTGRYIR